MNSINAPTNLHNAIRLLEEAKRDLVALYLDVSPDHPDYEFAVAETVVPLMFREPIRKIRVARDHIANFIDLDL